jgi:hypothetical protein
LGLTERQFWNSTPREISAFYRILAHKEGRWRFYMATAMGAKHRSGRQLVRHEIQTASRDGGKSGE